MHAENRQQRQQSEVPADQPVGAHRGTPILLAAGLGVLLACAVLLVATGDLRASATSAIGILLAGAVGYAAACLSLARNWADWSPRSRQRALLAILTVAFVMRAFLVFAPPSLSDDIYRYRWDGRVQAHGINPYLEPPGAVRLENLRDEHWAQINYPRIRSIYPPLAQLLFAATYQVSHSVRAFQLLAVLGDVAVIALIYALLTAWSQPRWYLALYALHPLPAVEFASSGHFDAWTCAAVLAAILAHVKARPAISTILLAAGVLLKTWPLVFVPLLLRRRPRWHLLLFAGTIVLVYLPYLDAGAAMLQPWLDYTGRWRFNDGILWLLAAVSGSLELGKAIAAGAGLGLLLLLWRRDVEPIAGGYWLLLAFIALMPTIHPWYLLWALPLAALALDLGWVTLCALAPVAYWILVVNAGASDAWVEPVWPRFVEFLPAGAIWLAQWRRHGVPRPGPLPGADAPVAAAVSKEAA